MPIHFYSSGGEELLTCLENSSIDHTINSHFISLYISCSSGGQEILKYQYNSLSEIMSLVLMTSNDWLRIDAGKFDCGRCWDVKNQIHHTAISTSPIILFVCVFLAPQYMQTGLHVHCLDEDNAYAKLWNLWKETLSSTIFILNTSIVNQLSIELVSPLNYTLNIYRPNDILIILLI